MNRMIRSWLAPGVIATALVVATPLMAMAQTCVAIPAQRNEIWVAGTGETGLEEPRGGAAFAFHFLDVAVFTGDVVFGGYDTGTTAAVSSSAQVGLPKRFGGLVVCPSIGVSRTGYDFLDRFGSQRGEVAERRYSVMLPIGGFLPTVAGADLRWSIAPSVSYRRWKLAGRSVFFVDALDLVLDDRDESSFDLTGRAAITLRTGRISVTGGVGSLVATEREFVTFLQLGWMATRIEG
jgi:hypothetical protein